MNNRINQLSDVLFAAVENWTKPGEPGKVVVDPVDGVPVRAHYALSHIAAAAIISGLRTGCKQRLVYGVDLVRNILANWQSDIKKSDFHFDFNNFALCIIYEKLSPLQEYSDISGEIREKIIGTPDSRHDTVNWLPMRIFVNRHRLDWTHDGKYLRKIRSCQTRLLRAVQDDGFIDDWVLPQMSFSLQYNISTLAVADYIGETESGINIENSLSALLDIILPDGDINYLGRGCNQIFAWGPWIYLLNRYQCEEQLSAALDYLQTRLQVCVQNNNIMLNDYQGPEKYLWYDYHHFTVYFGYTLFWLNVALSETNRKKLYEARPASSTNFKKYTKNGTYLMLFNGRKKYLSERGPQICALSLYDGQIAYKGGFGPWLGLFGNKYSSAQMAIHNQIGVVNVNSAIGYSRTVKLLNRVFNRLGLFKEESGRISQEAAFCDIEVNYVENKLILQFTNKTSRLSYFNFAVHKSSGICADKVQVKCDGILMRVYLCCTARNQYEMCNIFTTPLRVGRIWSLELLIDQME